MGNLTCKKMPQQMAIICCPVHSVYLET